MQNQNPKVSNFTVLRARSNGHLSWDHELAIVETRNFARVLQMHLDRCDSPEIAEQIYEILEPVMMGFANKGLANKLKAS